MNAQHTLNKLVNRAKRIYRRVIEIEATKSKELERAREHHNDADVSNYNKQIHRLNQRSNEIQKFLNEYNQTTV